MKEIATAKAKFQPTSTAESSLETATAAATVTIATTATTTSAATTTTAATTTPTRNGFRVQK